MELLIRQSQESLGFFSFTLHFWAEILHILSNGLLPFNEKRDLMFQMFNQDAGMPFDVFEGFSGSGDDLFNLRQGFLIHSRGSDRRYCRRSVRRIQRSGTTFSRLLLASEKNPEVEDQALASRMRMTNHSKS